MIHYTVNTGHWIDSPRSGVSAAALEALKPLAKPGVYQMPVYDDLQVTVNVGANSAGFSISVEAIPVIVAGLTWRAENQKILAQGLESLNAFVGVALTHDPMPPVPATVPWLGVILCDGVALLGERLLAIADFERCLAWAILDTI